MSTFEMATGKNPTPTTWLDHDDPRYVDEWARVLEMRADAKKGGYDLAGRRVLPGDHEAYDNGRGLANRRTTSLRPHQRQGGNHKAERHFSSN